MNTALAAASHTLKISARNHAVPTTQRVIKTMEVNRSPEVAFPQRATGQSTLHWIDGDALKP